MDAKQARELILAGEVSTGLHVEETLDLHGCTGVTTLPDNLYVSGSLNLCGCVELMNLPNNLYVGYSLILNNDNELLITNTPLSVLQTYRIHWREQGGLLGIPAHVLKYPEHLNAQDILAEKIY